MIEAIKVKPRVRSSGLRQPTGQIWARRPAIWGS